MILREMAFENIVGKGENGGKQHLPLFPQCFLPCQDRNHYFSTICHLQML